MTPRLGGIGRVTPAGQVTAPWVWSTAKSSTVNPSGTAGRTGGGFTGTTTGALAPSALRTTTVSDSKRLSPTTTGTAGAVSSHPSATFRGGDRSAGRPFTSNSVGSNPSGEATVATRSATAFSPGSSGRTARTRGGRR